ncbi:MAG: hypothetical protein CL607_02730 [Anaerolineaceae bacterium]|nr:hypothetical protein [Anaerolineaceae bacterium]
MDLFATLILISIMTLIGIGLWVWQRERLRGDPMLEDLMTEIPLPTSEASSAVLVATAHGQIIHVNDVAQDWLQLEGVNPNIELIARLAQPSDNFLNLWAGNGHSSFQLRDRWVDAITHKIPSPEGTRIIMIMRDLKAAAPGTDIMDMGQAMRIIDDIGEIAAAEMSINQTTQVVLEILRKRLEMDAGEICLWDADEEKLVQRSWIGDSRYLLTIAEMGGAYPLGHGVAGWVGKQRRPLLIHGEHDIVSLQVMMENNPYRSAVSVPLMLSDEFQGTLTLFSEYTGTYNDSHVALLQSVGRTISQTIRTSKLYTMQESRIRDIASVQELAQRGEHMADSATIFQALTARIAKLMKAQITGVFLYEPDRQMLIPQMPFHGIPNNVAQLIAIPLQEDTPQRDIWERQPYWVTNDASEDPFIEAMGLRPIIDLAGITTAGLFPLSVGGARIGMLAVNNMRSGNFSAADIDSMGVLATQAAIVVENLRLYEAERRIDSELVGLQEMTEAIGALPQGGAFYNEVNTRIARLMGVSMSGILRFDEQEEALIAELPFFGVEDDMVRLYRIPLPQNSIMEELWSDEDVWYSNRIETDPLVFKAGLDQIAEAIGIKQTLIAVMNVAGRRSGVIQLSNKVDGTDFNDNDARLARILATQAGAIIENARLYQEVQRRADQSESLRRVVELASSVLTSDDSLEPMLAAIAQVVASELVFISVLDQADGRLITYPRWSYGYDLREPVIIDADSPDFEYTIAMSGRPFVSNTVLSEESILPSYQRVADRYDIRKMMLVPLMVGDRSLGEVGVGNPTDGRDYALEDVDQLQSVAVQISSAVERLLLYRATGENLRQRMDELDSIARISNALTETVDLNHVIEVICNEIKLAAHIVGCSVALVYPEDRWRSPDRPRMDKRIGDLVGSGLSSLEVDAILDYSEPLVIADYETSEYDALPGTARSAAVVPIFYLNQKIGVLHAYDTQPNRFDEQAIGFLLTMAAKAAQGYQNAENRREQEERSLRLQQRVGQLNRIFELGQLIHTGTDPIDIMEAIVYSVQSSAAFDIVIALLNNPKTHMLRRVANVGMPVHAFIDSKQYEISVASFNDAMKPEYQIAGSMDSYFFPMERSPEWYTEEMRALATSFDSSRSLDGLTSNAWRDGDMLVVRISGHGDDIIGALVLDRPYNNQRPDRSVAEVLEIFAHQASSMVENTRLFMESERSAQLEAQLNDILNAVASSLELPQIASAIAKGITDMVPLMNLDLVINNEETGGFDAINAMPDGGGQFRLVREELLSLQDTALGNVYEGRRDQLYLADADTDVAFDDLSRWQAAGEQASLLLPLLAGGENLGVLHIGLSDTTSLTPEIRQLLMRMARLVAGSIQNARLFNQAVNLQILTSSVVESIQQGIIVLDQVGNVINFNDFMRQHYNWEVRELDRHLFDYSPEWEGFMQEELRSVLQDGIPRELIEQASPRDNENNLVRNYYLYPLRSGEDIRGAVLLVEDISERAELEKAIESRANQLAALTEVSTRITASLERDEVIQMAIDEIGWIIPSDAVSLWRRIGSFMTLEHYTGIEGEPQVGMRVLIREVERFNDMVEHHHAVSHTSEEPLAFNELPGDEDDVRSWLGVPLISQGHVSGALVLTGHQADMFDARAEQHVASAFASQVAIALANADLFEQTFERTNEMGIMLEAAQATSLTRDLAQVFETVAELLFNALDMAECAIMIWDEIDDEMVVQFSRTRDESVAPSIYEGDSFTASEFPAREHAIKMREVVVVMDVEDESGDPIYPTELGELRSAGFTVRMLVPLIVTNRPIGLIMLQQNAEHPEQGVSQQKMRLARALGLQVAAAIENARLSNETHIRFEELLTINALSQAVSATLNLNDMLPMVRDQLPTVTGAEEMYLALYDEETNRITFPMAVRGRESFNIPSRELGDDEVSYVIKHGRSLNLGADYFSIDQIRKNLGIETSEPDALSYLGVPLSVGKNVLGALAIRDTHRKQAFNINAERVLATVASQLAAAIQNAHLYERVQASAASLENIVAERTDELETERDRLDTLYQITSELTRTLDMEQLLDRALGMVSKAVGASDGVIILLDPSTDGLSTRAWLDPGTIYQSDDGKTMHAAETLATWLIIQNELNEPIVLVEDLSEEDYWDASLPHADQFQSAMAVILENNDEPVGVMVLLSTDLGAFDDNHLKLLVPAANQVAASINSADLYQLIRDQAARLANLVRQEKETSQRSNAVLESIADGVMLADASGRIVSFNAAAERILRIKRHEAEGQLVSTLAGLYGSSAARWSDMIENWSAQMEGRELSDGDTYFAEQRIELGNRVISAAIAPVAMEGGDLLGTVSVFRDITRDVEADRIKSEFIENVSHEFRTPLTPIKGYTDLLLQGATGVLNDSQHNMIGVIKDNVERLTALVDDVLNIAQLDRSGMLALVQEADVKQIVHNVPRAISERPANVAKQIDLTVDVADDVPLIHADHDRLEQILSNLLDNAYKFTRSGGEIAVKVERENDDHILLSVADTGVGIPEEFYDRIWNRFERYEQHALEMEVSGTGLGLPLVRELVTMHGGEIWFESEIDKGTTFFVRLPVDQPGYRRLLGEQHSGAVVKDAPESMVGD